LIVALRGFCAIEIWLRVVRRPKPLIPLTTAPHRVSANNSSSWPDATVALARTTPSASIGAVITIPASDTYSFVVNAFMRFCVASIDLFAMQVAPRMNAVVTRDVPSSSQSRKTQQRRAFLRSRRLHLSPCVNKKSPWIYKHDRNDQCERRCGAFRICVCKLNGLVACGCRLLATL
jgi:hypothetical protein